MTGIKENDIGFQAGPSNKVTPDELDMYYQYAVINPTTSATWFGTCAGGTATVAKPLVIINKLADYPRNILYSAVGTNDFGGTWTVNGRDQFGGTIQETVVSGTVAAGTPAFAIAGTKIFAEVTSGTFTATSTSVGGGSARIGACTGTAAGSANTFGLPVKIAAVTDVKSITWSKEHVVTTFNGGSLTSAHVGTTNHTFQGTAVLGGTEVFVVNIRPTWDNAQKASMAIV